jgi:hypothetical protein
MRRRGSTGASGPAAQREDAEKKVLIDRLAKVSGISEQEALSGPLPSSTGR